MTDSPTPHWTTDQDLLAEYILGRVDPNQLASLEQHLRECAQCRDAVAAEQQLAAGVRRAGRDALKSRLAQRVAQKRPRTNWYRAAGVAAAIIVLLTIGIYNKWFFSGETQLADLRVQTDSTAAKAESTPVKPPPGRQTTEQQEISEYAKPPATAGREREVSKGTGASRAELDKKKDAEGQKAMNVPVPAAPQDAVSMKAEMAAAVEPIEVWVEGTELGGELSIPTANNVVIEKSEGLRRQVPKKMKEPATLMTQAPRINYLLAGSPVEVTQRPVSGLPQNQLRARQDVSRVQTFLRSDSSGLSMVLFSDSLLSSSDLRQARLETVGQDSVVLHVGRQMIGYRLPAGLAQQLVRQLQQAK